MKDIKKLWHFVTPYTGTALFSLVMLAAMVVLDLSIPRLVGRLIDEGVRQLDLGVVIRLSVVMLGLSLAHVTVAVLNSTSSIRVGESVARDLRQNLYEHIQGLSHGNLDKFSTGQLLVRLTSDTAAVQRLVQVTLRIGTRAPLSGLGAVVLMFVTSPTLALSIMPLLAAAGLIIWLFSARMEPVFRGVQERLDRLNTILQENIAGVRLVKAFVRKRHEEERFGQANERLMEGSVRTMKFMASMSPAITVLVNAGIVLVIWLGGSRGGGDGLSAGQTIAFANYLVATLHPLVLMTQLSTTWANGLASAKRVNEILDERPLIVEDERPEDLPAKAASSADVRGVTFRYDGERDEPALDDVNVIIQPGSVVAVLGATGAGKSTLAKLLPRFYDPERGSVALDGVDVRRASEASLRRRIAIVPQETVLFAGSVADNIRWGKPDATDAEVEEAARAACAHDFVAGLPEGYDTHIEERGVNLSGGQKQRLAIARAIIARPGILILDDATSAVDVETETRMHDSLSAYLRGGTVFMVAQRVSTVLNADSIVVLDGGRVASVGTHAELLASGGIYREIFDSQLGGGLNGQA